MKPLDPQKQFHVSFFRTLKNITPTDHECTWGDLYPALEEYARRHEPERGYVAATKEERASRIPLFSPARFRGDRKNANAEFISFIVLDIDDQPLTAATEYIFQPISQMNLAHYVYTTLSHVEGAQANPKVRLRVLLPLHTPAPAAQWPGIFTGLQGMFGGLIDGSTKDPARAYFLPLEAFTGTRKTRLHFFGRATGNALEIEDIVNRPTASADVKKPIRPMVGITDSFDRRSISRWCSALKRSSSPQQKELAKTISLILKGESFAPPGLRHNTILAVVRAITAKFNLSPKALQAFFSPSAQVMEQEDPEAKILYDIERITEWRNEALQGAVEEAKLKATDELGRAIWMAFSGSRDNVYTADELQHFYEAAGCTAFQFEKRWVIQSHNSFFFFRDGSYHGPYTRQEFFTGAGEQLSPAVSAGVELHGYTHTGRRTRKGFQEIMDSYGTVAQEVVYDLSAQDSKFENHKLVLPCCVPRNLTPEYSEDVATWLELLAGERKIGKVLDWMAVATENEYPCAAMFFMGPRGCGKSLFAHGMAKLWHEFGPIPMKSVFGKENALLKKCPLVFADESLPSDYKGNTQTDELREFIQARTRTLEQKYVTAGTLVGCVRVVIAANNDLIMDTSESLTINDIEAIADRIIYVPVSPQAGSFLAGLSPEKRKDLVDGDVIAKHAKWLAKHRDVDRSHRFLVTGEDHTLVDVLTVSTGDRSIICEWCANYILKREKLHMDGSERTVMIRDGKLLVTARGISQHWSRYVDVRKIRLNRIAQALKGLCLPEEESHPSTHSGDNRWFRVVDTKKLLVWCTEHGYASHEQIYAALKS